MDTLCRIPISKPLTHRIILIKEKFFGMSLTRERTHELDKIFQGRIVRGTGFLSILPISLPTRESGIRRHKYLSAAIFKKAAHSDDP